MGEARSRRAFTSAQKAEIDHRQLSGKEPVSKLAEELKNQPSQIHHWVRAEKHHHVQITHTLGSDCLYRVEITSPEGFAVACQKVSPRIGNAIRARFDPSHC